MELVHWMLPITMEEGNDSQEAQSVLWMGMSLGR